VELAITVAIVSVLAAVAIPAYDDYGKRTRVAELILAASDCRNTVAEVYREASAAAAPAANGWGCEAGPDTATPLPPSRHVRSVTTTVDGKIVVTAQGFNDAAVDGEVLTMTPLIAPGEPATLVRAAGRSLYGWRCGSKADATTIPARYLPGSCRG